MTGKPSHRRWLATASPAFLIPLGVSALLGLVGGTAFHWAPPAQAWNVFTAAFLWTLISAAGTTIGRYAGERLRRGQWGRGLWIAHIQSFPLTTTYLLVAALASAQAALLPATAAVLYTCTLAVALAVAALGVLTSPYRDRF